jgi:nuclease HARBI1
MYHQAVIKKIISSPRNPNRGYIPQEVSDIFGFLDGTGLEIARPNNGVQNPFWNGYMHGHYLIFQGISFPDGMVVIEGAFPGYQPDTMVWRDSAMRGELEAIMAERFAAGRSRYKVYADKIYNNSLPVTAAYSRRDHRHGLQAWQTRLNRLMSDIRVGVEWSFGKIITRNKFVSFGRSMQIQKSPVSKFYHTALLISNAHTCMYGCQQTSYFGVLAPDVNEYFNQ